MTKKVLVLNNRGMGDCIISVMSFPYIKEILGDVDIYFGIHPRHSDLFKSDIFEENFTTLNLDIHSFSGILLFYKELSKIKPDYILELSPVRRVGKVVRLIKVLNPLLKFQFFTTKNQVIDSVPSELSSELNSLQCNLNDIWWSLDKKQKLPPSYKKYQKPICEQGDIIIMSMASSSFDHLYDVEGFSKLIHHVKRAFPDIEIIYPLSQTKVDQVTKAKLESLKVPVTFVESSLDELVTYFRRAMAFIGMDTGIKHLAVYMGIPTFTFIPRKSYPYSHSYTDKKHRMLLLDSKQNIAEEELANMIKELKDTHSV